MLFYLYIHKIYFIFSNSSITFLLIAIYLFNPPKIAIPFNFLLYFHQHHTQLFPQFFPFQYKFALKPFPSFVVYSQHPPSCSPLCQHFARAVNSSNNQTPSQLLKALLSVTEHIPPFAFCFQLQIRRFGCRKGKEYIRSKRTCCRILIFLEYFRKI